MASSSSSSIATLFSSFFSPPKSAPLKNPAPTLSVSTTTNSPARISSQVVSISNENQQYREPLSKPGLPEDLLSVMCPSLAYANTLLFNSAYNVQVVVDDNEPEEKLLNRFRREVMRAGVIQECKRRRFFENKQEEKKRKTREAARRNRRRRNPPRGGPMDRQDNIPKNKKEDEEEDNWEIPDGALPV